MTQVVEQFAAFRQAQVDTALRFSEITTEAFEKLAELNFATVKTAFADTVKSAKDLSAVKDPSALPTFGAGLTQPVWEKAQAYAKSVYEVTTAAQSEISALVEQQVAQYNKNVVAGIDALSKYVPSGAEGGLSAVKSAVESATAAYESLYSAGKKAVALTESKLASVEAKVAPARRKAA